MRLIWPILRETVIYFWEELFYLILFNFITLVTLMPGIVFMTFSQEIEAPPFFYVPVGILLASAFPYTLFGLFGTVHHIAEGRAIKFSTFFAEGKQMLKQAYIWWVINVVIFLVLLVNIIFYANLPTTWSGYVAFFFIGILLTWLLTQTYALTFYPKLKEPGFRLATRNAMALIAMRPIPVILMAIIGGGIVFGGILVQLVGLLLMLSLMATLINMTTHLILKEQQKAQAELER